MGKYKIYKTTSGNYQFKLLASNGEAVLTSEEYTTKNSCMNGVKSVKESAQFATNFIRKTSAKGYYFVLKANNGAIIGTSYFYASEAGRESGIYYVKVNALNDNIEY